MPAIDRLVELCGRILAAMLPLMVLITSAVVIARYLFDIGTIAGQEAVMYLHGTAFMLGFAYALKHNAHGSNQKLDRSSRSSVVFVSCVPVHHLVLMGLRGSCVARAGRLC